MPNCSPFAARAACLALCVSCLAAGAAPIEVLHFRDDDIEESSGLAVLPGRERLFLTHNDSGDSARVFLVDTSGKTVTTIDLEKADAVDWEDLALGAKDSAGMPEVLVGDIGDNDEVRPQVQIYRFALPADAGRSKRSRVRARKYQFTYPDRPRNAESLLVNPTSGQILIVSKSLLGSEFFVAPNPPVEGRPNRLRLVGKVQFPQLLKQLGKPTRSLGSALATGGAISPDGKRLVLRTYTDAFEWRIPVDGLAGIGRVLPRWIEVPDVAMGESITYSPAGDRCYTSAEGKHAPVHEIALR